VGFARTPEVDQATPPDTARLHRLRRAITVLRWVVAIAVFVPLADFLGGVDLVDFVGSPNGWLPSTVLGLFFAALISGSIALTFGTAIEWACRHRLERAHHDAAAARIADTAARTVRRP
jgi:hypothetical protein